MGQTITGMGNLGLMIVFGGCMEGGPADSMAEILPQGGGSGSNAAPLPSMAHVPPTSSRLGVSSSLVSATLAGWQALVPPPPPPPPEPVAAVSPPPQPEEAFTYGWGGGGAECAAQGYLWSVPYIPIWLVLAVGGLWTVGGSTQVTGECVS